uniref:Uncharacterized protein n=1 Tax=Arundo donax TaxID=35708 RepID=A0A0A8YS50_ARUDO
MKLFFSSSAAFSAIFP